MPSLAVGSCWIEQSDGDAAVDSKDSIHPLRGYPVDDVDHVLGRGFGRRCSQRPLFGVYKARECGGLGFGPNHQGFGCVVADASIVDALVESRHAGEGPLALWALDDYGICRDSWNKRVADRHGLWVVFCVFFRMGSVGPCFLFVSYAFVGVLYLCRRDQNPCSAFECTQETMVCFAAFVNLFGCYGDSGYGLDGFRHEDCRLASRYLVARVVVRP